MILLRVTCVPTAMMMAGYQFGMGSNPIHHRNSHATNRTAHDLPNRHVMHPSKDMLHHQNCDLAPCCVGRVHSRPVALYLCPSYTPLHLTMFDSNDWWYRCLCSYNGSGFSFNFHYDRSCRRDKQLACRPGLRAMGDR